MDSDALDLASIGCSHSEDGAIRWPVIDDDLRGGQENGTCFLPKSFAGVDDAIVIFEIRFDYDTIVGVRVIEITLL